VTVICDSSLCDGKRLSTKYFIDHACKKSARKIMKGINDFSFVIKLLLNPATMVLNISWVLLALSPYGYRMSAGFN